MMDIPTRLVIAYGLIGLVVLAAAAAIRWAYRNTHRQRVARERAKYEKRCQLLREEAASSHSAADH